jgi:signal transduction histidine kinase
MESETARCGDIVKDLLAFARRTKITMESNSIEDIIDKTLNLISHELEIKELQLKTNIAPNLPKVKCDFKQIQQVLLNLMYNASEAMSNGGMLTIAANRTNGAQALLEVTISDTGCGISEKDMEHIFEPFFTTKEEGKGVGLGLSVVYGIIARHNGTITVESEPGKGSTFTVRLPCS